MLNSYKISIVQNSTLYIVFFCLLSISKLAVSDYAIAYGYTPKYNKNFSHFDYVNPDAPKGGRLDLNGSRTFDRLNPFLLKGVAADGIEGLIIETLMEQSLDEPYTFYGLIADDIKVAEDGLSVTYHINTKAQFSDGTSVTVEDIKFSFDTLMQDKHVHPAYKITLGDISDAEIIDTHTIRFNFKVKNPKLPMLLNSYLSIFPRHWVGDLDFKDTAMKIPIGSGPYVLDSYDTGKQLKFKRNPDYWAAESGIRKGMFNFDEVVYKYFRDSTIALEAMKAGEYDFRHEYNSKMWARDYTGRVFKNKEIIKNNIPHSNSVGIQGFVLNTRKPLFNDKRVREALVLAYDFEWANRMLFYNQYQRNDSYFSNTELAARGAISQREYELLLPFKEHLATSVFENAWTPPVTCKPSSLRNNLRQAIKLLKSAGWEYNNGALRNSDGKAFTFDLVLSQKAFERIAASYARNLKKLGIIMNYRTVDFALYKRKVETKDFDMIVSSYPQSQVPGNELESRWHSKTADVDGSANYPGIKNPAIDALLEQLSNTKDRQEIIAITRAMDRVLLSEFYLVPHWYISTHRIAYWDKFEFPQTLPDYFSAEGWMLSTWWFKPEYRKLNLSSKKK
ncbi:MAG: extracellular solute-binding protein [gamma proteobacterium symbiont of Bathyaustriella thionipta]|nr:extracellular solute-binding protein [gamma proteobacterium symbiont of Bathyaustriella thionipta]MCU7950580.1 extracellular solute-binding protein [gamma proteobacterium symbiont of Bathyaustriella thionipta]MCU7954640.1 extracellular solute-binding protein [gamma proteobacterium symbiont of Bathyaustriella thionipta]MCU7957084.1 extracellular solute-binding protein [gamma proteobacterium symbiont of Bathyaustriella thionipta]MCU7966308.1 extracellular solute-binding protein [gamma proteoba